MNIDVSIVLSVFNGCNDLHITLDSILSQTFNNFELLIYDNASSDGTWEILSDYIQRDNRIWAKRNSINLGGPCLNAIAGIERAKGKYTARIDSGDYWVKNKLEKQVNFLDNNPDYVICGTQANFFYGNKILGNSNFACDDAEIRQNIVRRDGIYLQPSILFRNITNYRKQFIHGGEDLDLYLRLSFLGKMYCLNEKLLFCKYDEEGMTLGTKHILRQYDNYAYKCYSQRLDTGTDFIDQDPDVKLRIHNNLFDRYFIKLSMIFYKQYIRFRISQMNQILWGIFLIISLLLYPYLIIDYSHKFYGRLKLLLKTHFILS